LEGAKWRKSDQHVQRPGYIGGKWQGRRSKTLGAWWMSQPLAVGLHPGDERLEDFKQKNNLIRSGCWEKNHFGKSTKAVLKELGIKMRGPAEGKGSFDTHFTLRCVLTESDVSHVI